MERERKQREERAGGKGGRKERGKRGRKGREERENEAEKGDTKFLARYHGYQFGVYNPNIGDGRGFIYGQIRGKYPSLLFSLFLPSSLHLLSSLPLPFLSPLPLSPSALPFRCPLPLSPSALPSTFSLSDIFPIFKTK
jgi:hypothetical protein